MKTTNEMIKHLKQHGVLIIENHMQHTVQDLTFTLDCLCIPFTKRVVESTRFGRVTKIRMTNVH